MYDAPDDSTAAAVMMRGCSKGNVRTETLRGFTEDKIEGSARQDDINFNGLILVDLSYREDVRKAKSCRVSVPKLNEHMASLYEESPNSSP